MATCQPDEEGASVKVKRSPVWGQTDALGLQCLEAMTNNQLSFLRNVSENESCLVLYRCEYRCLHSWLENQRHPSLLALAAPGCAPMTKADDKTNREKLSHSVIRTTEVQRRDVKVVWPGRALIRPGCTLSELGKLHLARHSCSLNSTTKAVLVLTFNIDLEHLTPRSIRHAGRARKNNTIKC